MDSQIKYWDDLLSPGIVALVGAGGKTTVLSKLVEYSLLRGRPIFVTTTTKLYEHQVAQWNPFYGDDVKAADAYLSKQVSSNRCAAWFKDVEDRKVLSLRPQCIDEMGFLHPDWQIVVEADGAKEKCVKAPKSTEPVIPSITKTTIGLVNLHMLGTPLDEAHVHNLKLVTGLLDCSEGAIMTAPLLAQLVLHKEGLFQYSKGRNIVFCTGYDRVPHGIVDDFVESLADKDIDMLILADGYKDSCSIRRIVNLK